MGRSWKDVKQDKEAQDRARGRDVETAREHAATLTQAYVLGDRLAQLRETRHVSQAEIAERMGISQARVSKLENGDPAHLELGTIRRYITALGATLKLIADFEDHDVTVSRSEVDRSAACA
ncbi:helix-turn-helix domain-containing protein [Bounagaea algeriensis]